MSSIHYFQRYSQPENVATNNTLLLLSRLYHHSPNKFKGFLNELLGYDIEAGVTFQQQTRGVNTIPDGSISQPSFKVVIETKRHQDFQISQLMGHVNDFGNETHKILLSLSPKLPDTNLQAAIRDSIQLFNKDNGTSIKYIATTFQQIVEKYSSTLESNDFELNQIVDDYKSYCNHEGLISDDEYWMRAVTCGWTLDENFQYSLYYRRASDGYGAHAYIGIYSDKSIRGIGKLENIIEADLLPNGKLDIKQSTSIPTELQCQNIIQTIEAARLNNNWDIRTGHNFFCVEKFYKTNFRKETKYPLQGTKFFNLKAELNLTALPATEEIAKLLNVRTW